MKYDCKIIKIHDTNNLTIQVKVFNAYINQNIRFYGIRFESIRSSIREKKIKADDTLREIRKKLQEGTLCQVEVKKGLKGVYYGIFYLGSDNLNQYFLDNGFAKLKIEKCK
jgi:hypothetical protein